MPFIPESEQKKAREMTEWKDATWHGPHPTRVLVYPGEPKVDVKPGQTVKVHPDIAKRLHQQERLWEVEGYPWVSLDESKAKKEEARKRSKK